jgi:DNA-binding beta-propeller fold protein YncE
MSGILKSMNRTSGLLMCVMCLLLVVIASLAACGQSITSTSGLRLAASVPAGETLYVLDGAGGSAGGQRILAIHPGGTGATSITLLGGLATEDHQQLYVATPNGAQTTIAVLDTRTGATLRSFSIAGRYATDSYGYGGATLTPNGQWLALRQVGQAGGSQSTIALVDTLAGKLARTIQLGGDFDIDALSPDGSVLYLLQNLHDAQHHYYVRAYDVGAGSLLSQIIVDKSEIDHPQMQGSAVARRIGSYGGAAAFTLYIDPLRNTAFVHVLPLDSSASISGFARCVDDLPASTSLDLLRSYTLVLSADGTTLYAINAALGVASKITTGDATNGGIFGAHVLAAGHFEPMGSADGAYGAGGILSNGAALSADGATLYVAGAHGLQVIRTSDMRPQGVYLAGHTLTGVAASANSKLLYVTDARQGVLLLSSDGSRWEQLAINGAQAPGGIAWVNG